MFQHLSEINAAENTIPLLSNEQNLLEYNMKIDPPGRYVLVLEYVTPVTGDVAIHYDNSTDVDASARGVVLVNFRSGDRNGINAIANLNDCPYTTPCRQVVVDPMAKIEFFVVHDANNFVLLRVS